MSNEEVDYSQYGVQVGKASYDRKTFNSFKIEDGSNVYRILPPLGEAAAQGIWNVGWAVHWGYKNSKGKMRPFACPQKIDRKTKMIIHRCPECERLADFDKVYKDKLAAFTKEFGEEKAKKKLKHYSEHLFQYNRGFKIFVNAYNEKGVVGALGLNMTFFNFLKIEAEKLQKKGIDMTALHQGAWFDFFKDGSRTFKVELVRQEDESLKPGKVPVEVLKGLKNSARDLNNLFTVLTDEQIQKLADSDGNPEVVDAIFGSGEPEETPAGDSTAAASAARAQQALSGAKQEAKPEPVKQEAKPEPEDEPETSAEDEAEEPLPGKQAASTAKDEEEPEPIAKTRPVTQLPAGQSVATMDSDAFRALVKKK